MSKITRHSDWCQIDRLDGIDIVDGELLLIMWPDGGPSTIVKARVQKGSFEVSDHGHPYTCPSSLAFTRIDYRGVSVLISLVGLEAQRYAK